MAVSDALVGAIPGGWSGEHRTAAARVADYDWDGSIRACAAEITQAIAGHEAEISRAFWEHYLSLPVSAPNVFQGLLQDLTIVLTAVQYP